MKRMKKYVWIYLQNNKLINYKHGFNYFVNSFDNQLVNAHLSLCVENCLFDEEGSIHVFTHKYFSMEILPIPQQYALLENIIFV